MPDDTHLPTTQRPIGDIASDIGSAGLPPSLRILLDDGFYNRVKQLAAVMANAVGFTPAHLLGKAEACFTVITISLDAKLSPNFVAKNTYQTPAGQIGYNGALVQSILEQSGKFIGAPIYEYHGDWSTIMGKFELRRNDKGREYVKPAWTQKDAVGLGVIVRWFVRGEKVARVWPGEKEPFWLAQCFPLNSPLWATDPKTQIAYLAIRRFANITSPGILGAAAHDYDEIIDASESARDVTPPPRPRRSDLAFRDPPVEEEEASVPLYKLTNCDGELFECTVEMVEEELLAIFAEAQHRNDAAIEAALDNNEETVTELMALPQQQPGLRLQHEVDMLRAYLARARAANPLKRHRATKLEMEERRRAAQQNPETGTPGSLTASEEVETRDAREGERQAGSPASYLSSESRESSQPSQNPADGPPVRPAAEPLSDGNASPKTPPSLGEAEPRTQTSPTSQGAFIVPMRYERDGQTPAYRAWWLAAFLPSLRAFSKTGAAEQIKMNDEVIQIYFKTISTPSKVAALAERDEIIKGLT